MTTELWMALLGVLLAIVGFSIKWLITRTTKRMDALEANAVTGRQYAIQNEAIRESLSSISAKTTEGFASIMREIKAVEAETRRLDERQHDRVSAVVRELHVKIDERERALLDRIDAARGQT